MQTLSDLNLSYGQSIKLAIMALEHARFQAASESAAAPSNARDIIAHWDDRFAKTEEALESVRQILKPLETRGERATALPEVLA
jgi:hypothetical protein